MYLHGFSRRGANQNVNLKMFIVGRANQIFQAANQNGQNKILSTCLLFSNRSCCKFFFSFCGFLPSVRRPSEHLLLLPPKRSNLPASSSQGEVGVNSFFFLRSSSFSSQVEESRIRVDHHGPRTTDIIRLPPGLRPATKAIVTNTTTHTHHHHDHD